MLAPQLSVIVITHNEALNISDCLQSVSFADECVVVDSGSTDATVALARAAMAQVVTTPDWPGFGPQKNRALALARGDWVLALDADERVTKALQAEILDVLSAPIHDAYELPRLSSFCGHFIRPSGWYPDHNVRLFRRRVGRFSPDLVHERVLVCAGSTGRLKTPLVHLSYADDDVYLRKLQQYSSLGSEQAYARGKRGGLGTALVHAAAAFLRSFFFKHGWLDGRAGLMVAISSGESSYHKYFKLMLLTEAGKRIDELR